MSDPASSAPPARVDAGPRPQEIRVRRASRTLEIDFDDGRHAVLPAEYLRVESPSAEVRGHGQGPRKLVHGKRLVAIEIVEPIGHYAVRIRFTDGHDTGIYSWALLHTLAHEHDARWQAYLASLAQHGLTRDS